MPVSKHEGALCLTNPAGGELALDTFQAVQMVHCTSKQTMPARRTCSQRQNAFRENMHFKKNMPFKEDIICLLPGFIPLPREQAMYSQAE